MDTKKLKTDDVSQTGWWRQQGSTKEEPIVSSNVSSITDTVGLKLSDLNENQEKDDPDTESTISRVIRKLDIFK